MRSGLTEEEKGKVDDFLVQLYTNVAYCYNNLNNPQRGIESAKKAIEIKFMYSKAYLMAFEASVKLNENKQAEEYLKKAYEFDPKNKELK